MCIQWTSVLYSVVLTRQYNPSISQFNSPCNEFTSGQCFYTIPLEEYLSPAIFSDVFNHKFRCFIFLPTGFAKTV